MKKGHVVLDCPWCRREVMVETSLVTALSTIGNGIASNINEHNPVLIRLANPCDKCGKSISVRIFHNRIGAASKSNPHLVEQSDGTLRKWGNGK